MDTGVVSNETTQVSFSLWTFVATSDLKRTRVRFLIEKKIIIVRSSHRSKE